jgi:hypothetical protein
MQRRVALLIGVWAAVCLIQVGWSQLPSPPQQIRGRTLTEWKQKLTSQDASEVYQALVALRSVNQHGGSRGPCAELRLPAQPPEHLGAD